jgi:hypothetical protein
MRKLCEYPRATRQVPCVRANSKLKYASGRGLRGRISSGPHLASAGQLNGSPYRESSLRISSLPVSCIATAIRPARFSNKIALRSGRMMPCAAHSHSNRLTVNNVVPAICANSSQESSTGAEARELPDSAIRRSRTLASLCGTRSVANSCTRPSKLRMRCVRSRTELRSRAGNRWLNDSNSAISQLKMRQCSTAYAPAECVLPGPCPSPSKTSPGPSTWRIISFPTAL